MGSFTDTTAFHTEMEKKFSMPLAKEDITKYMEIKNRVDQNQKKIQEALELLSSTYESDTVDLVVHCLFKNHRTHQQSIIKNIFNSLKKYGELNYWDHRNEQAVKWAREATKEQKCFPYI